MAEFRDRITVDERSTLGCKNVSDCLNWRCGAVSFDECTVVALVYSQ